MAFVYHGKNIFTTGKYLKGNLLVIFYVASIKKIG